MSDTYRNVTSDDRFFETADFRNAVNELLRAHQRTKQNFGNDTVSSEVVPQRPPPILVLNQSGQALAQYSVVSVFDPINKPADNELEFAERVTFRSTLPDQGSSFAVLLEAAPDGEPANAVMSGLIQCKVNIGDMGHPYAGIEDENYEYLVSQSTLGPAKIVWRDMPTPTTLDGTIDISATTLTVASSDGLPDVPFVVLIGTEKLQVTAIDGLEWTVARGVSDTFASSHDGGASVVLAEAIIWCVIRFVDADALQDASVVGWVGATATQRGAVSTGPQAWQGDKVAVNGSYVVVGETDTFIPNLGSMPDDDRYSQLRNSILEIVGFSGLTSAIFQNTGSEIPSCRIASWAANDFTNEITANTSFYLIPCAAIGETINRGLLATTAQAQVFPGLSDPGFYPFVVTVESEQILVTAFLSSLVWTVTRGHAGTTPTAHANGTIITGIGFTTTLGSALDNSQTTLTHTSFFTLRKSCYSINWLSGANGILDGAWSLDGNGINVVNDALGQKIAGGIVVQLSTGVSLGGGGTGSDLSATGPGIVFQADTGANLTIVTSLPMLYGGTGANLNVHGPGVTIQASAGAGLTTVSTLPPVYGGLGVNTSGWASGSFPQANGAGGYTQKKNNLAGGGAPTVNDDSGDGFSVGSVWVG